MLKNTTNKKIKLVALKILMYKENANVKDFLTWDDPPLLCIWAFSYWLCHYC